MKRKQCEDGEGSGDDVPTLIQTLHETERRLRQFVKRKVDSPSAEATWQAGILNALPASIALLDGYGHIISINDAWRAFARANQLPTPRFGIGANYLDICDNACGADRAEAALVSEGIRSVLAGTTRTFSIEYPCHSATQLRWFLLKVTPLTDDGGDGAVVMHLDITERKQAATALHTSQEAMRLSLEAAHIGYWDLDLLSNTPTRSLLHDQIFGYEELTEDWSYERFLEHVVSMDREHVDRVFKAGLAAKAEWDVECRIIRADGKRRWIWLHGDVLTNEVGDATRTLGVVVDITDRKNTEEAMRESEERFAGAFEQAPIGMALLAPDGGCFKVNRVLCDLLGYSESELLDLSFQDLTHPEDLDRDVAHVERMLAGEISTYRTEKRYIHAGGRTVPALLSASIVRDDHGYPRYFIVHIQDNTARKTFEQAIERAMHRLSEAQRIGMIGDWEYVPATQEITWSAQLFEILGRDPSLGPPRDYAENATLFDESHRTLQHRKYQLTVDSGQPQDYELLARRPDGTPVHVHVLAVPVKDEFGTVVRIHGTVQDISGRKQADSDTRRLADRLTRTLDNMSDAFFTLDRDWNFTYLNHYAELLLGRGQTDLLGRSVWTEFPTAVGSIFEREYRRALEDNVSVAFEEYFGQLGCCFSVRAYPSEHGLAVYFRDVTQSRRAADALRASEEEFRKLAEAMPQIVWVARADGWYTYINPQWSDYTGLTLDDSLGHGWQHAFHADDRVPAFESWQNSVDAEHPYSIEGRLRRSDGVYRWWLIRGVPVHDAEGQVSKWFGTCTDIHDRKIAELELSRVNLGLRESGLRNERLNRVYEVLSQINALIVRKPDRNELFRDVCRVAVELGEFRFAWIGLVDRDAHLLTPAASAGGMEEFFERAPPEVFHCHPGTTSRSARAILERQPQLVNDFTVGPAPLMQHDMEARGIRAFAIIPLIVHGEAIGVFALYAQEAGFFDAEETRLLQELAGNIALSVENIEKQERLDYLAYYDPLTGLATRSLFLDRVSQHMRAATSAGHKLALFMLDLERFKNINDSLGRTAGDTLLKKVAELMARRGGDASLLARVGPNQFAAVVPKVKSDGDLGRLIENALTFLNAQPFELEDAVLRISVKVGAAVFPKDGSDAETLFQNAEAALKQAKANGDRYLFHSSSMTASVAGKLGLENQLRRALDNNEFVLHYQPKVNLASGEVTGAEALIRWNAPGKGLVPPGEFIPVLEETGLIHEVGRWAMRQAVDDYLRWCDAGLPGVRIAVNVSALQLRSRDFVAEVAQVLAGDPRAASGLELEITESMVMGDIDHGIASLRAIRDMGVRIALDDFGTGFSSLSYLARLPVNTLKIDRSFINDIASTPEGLALVSTIITLAHSLRHVVVAEGVETDEQVGLLRSLDCDEMQGFHFSKPVPRATFESRYLAKSPA